MALQDHTKIIYYVIITKLSQIEIKSEFTTKYAIYAVVYAMYAVVKIKPGHQEISILFRLITIYHRVISHER